MLDNFNCIYLWSNFWSYLNLVIMVFCWLFVPGSYAECVIMCSHGKVSFRYITGPSPYEGPVSSVTEYSLYSLAPQSIRNMNFLAILAIAMYSSSREGSKYWAKCHKFCLYGRLRRGASGSVAHFLKKLLIPWFVYISFCSL